MIDNYSFLSARRGESLLAFGVTDDSDTKPNFENKRVMRIPAPHFLPPTEVGELYDVSEWNLSVLFTPSEDFIEGLEGTTEFTFKAGKQMFIVDLYGEIITLESEGPGWESVLDGITGNQYFDEEQEIYVDGRSSFGFEKFVSIDVEDEILEETFTYILLLRVECEIIGPRPMIYIENDEPQEVWEIEIRFYGEAKSYAEFDPEPNTPTVSTRVGTYVSKSGDLYPIGEISSEEINDDSIQITLSAASYHETFS